MPKSKVRGSGKLSHYNSNSGLLTHSQKVARYGKRSKPIPGSNLRVNTISPYMGTVINAETRLEYEKQQAEAFKERYIQDIVNKRKAIQDQEDKTEDEIELELYEFNNNQVSEQYLDELAVQFARFQSNKETKHYKAWLAGKTYFNYKGRSFPVLTESFLNKTQSIKDIIKVGPDDTINSRSGKESTDSSKLLGDNQVGDDEAL